MKILEDVIEIQAYSELMISCQIKDCVEDFDSSLTQAAQDPVEKWAVDMAKKARLAGWTANNQGLVVCPKHSKQVKQS